MAEYIATFPVSEDETAYTYIAPNISNDLHLYGLAGMCNIRCRVLWGSNSIEVRIPLDLNKSLSPFIKFEKALSDKISEAVAEFESIKQDSAAMKEWKRVKSKYIFVFPFEKKQVIEKFLNRSEDRLERIKKSGGNVTVETPNNRLIVVLVPSDNEEENNDLLDLLNSLQMHSKISAKKER